MIYKTGDNRLGRFPEAKNYPSLLRSKGFILVALDRKVRVGPGPEKASSYSSLRQLGVKLGNLQQNASGLDGGVAMRPNLSPERANVNSTFYNSRD